ncbi:cupin [Sphingopyxis panaciterrae]
MTQAETFILRQQGWVPNNERLPALLYRGAVKAEGRIAAEAFEQLFAVHGWPPQWRGSVFDYHHYHSTAHEALGVFAGFATLQLGGPGGKSVDVQAGDALLLPVGTGHCRVAGSDDFQVVGAYPEGMNWDVCTGAPSADTRARTKALPLPHRDPVTGLPDPFEAAGGD